jgi:hypothetical protein
MQCEGFIIKVLRLAWVGLPASYYRLKKVLGEYCVSDTTKKWLISPHGLLKYFNTREDLSHPSLSKFTI